MTKLIRNKLFLGAVCLLLAGILAFGLLPRLYRDQSSTLEVVTLQSTAESGTVISEDMLTVTEVGSYGLPKTVVIDKSELVGLVVRETVYAGEYLWRDRFMDLEEYENTKGQDGHILSDGKYLLTISLPTASSGVAGILRSGDLVDVYGNEELDGKIMATEALSSVVVYEVLNSKLVPLNELDEKLSTNPDGDASDYDFIPAYIVFIVDETQAKELIALEKEKSLHLVLREKGAQT